MSSVTCMRDLEKFGVQLLTGEACGYGRRILCDVTEKAAAGVARMFSVPSIKLSKPWNGGKINGVDKLGSIMIPYDAVPELAVWLMVEFGVKDIFEYDRCVYGRDPEDTDHEWNRFLEFYQKKAIACDKIFRVIRRSTHPGVGDRNVHAMSGRVV